MWKGIQFDLMLLLQNHFKAINHRELIKKLLLSGEIDSLNEAINNLNSAAKLEDTEVKN